jgi:predicted glycosyltransferase
LRILIDIGHPAHVHFFKYLIRNLEKDGHVVKITARDKEVTHALLKAYGFEYINRGELKKGMLNKAFGLFSVDYTLYKIAKEFHADLLLGVHNPYIAHAGKLLGKPSIIFTDTENVGVASSLTFPFADVIWTPSCFMEKINPKKQVKFNGFKELAYLHPNQFRPDYSVVERLGIGKDEKFIIVRFISWAASHDVSLHGIRWGKESDFIKSLEKYGRIFITSERPLGDALEKYRVKVPPEDIHSLLYYADLYIGEGGTMAAEAAVLGTPSIHVEANADGVATGSLSGNFCEFRDQYGLLYFFADQDKAFSKAVELLENRQSKQEWQRKRERLLQDKIDVTGWMTDFVEQYPESFEKYRRNHV